MADLLRSLGKQLREERRTRGFTQPQLAARTGRRTSRISELEGGLLKGHVGRDRLQLLAELCDALDLGIQLVPNRTRPADAVTRPSAPTSADRFEELFIDLSGDD